MPASRAASRASRPTKSVSLDFSGTAIPTPDSEGRCPRSSSLPYRGMPASRRRESRLANPQGSSPTPASSPAAARAFHTAVAAAESCSPSATGPMISSKPSSPVYPVRASSTGTSPSVPARTVAGRAA